MPPCCDFILLHLWHIQFCCLVCKMLFCFECMWILLTFLSLLNWPEFVLKYFFFFFKLYWLSQNFALCFIGPFFPPQAQLLDLRSELTESKAERSVLERELHDQLLQLHALQHAKGSQVENSDSSKNAVVRLMDATPLLNYNVARGTADGIGVNRCLL